MLKTREAKRNAIVVAILIFIGIPIVQFIYRNRCRLIECTPASWDTIRDIAISRARDDLRINYISAVPAERSLFKTSFTSEGPVFIEIEIGYVSSRWPSTPSKSDPTTWYSVNIIWFDDRAMHVGRSTLMEALHSSNEIPPANRPEILGRIKISPREAFRLAWAVAQTVDQLRERIDPIPMRARLNFRDRPGAGTGNPSWGVVLGFSFQIEVDAQTGMIIQVCSEWHKECPQPNR